MNRAEICQLLTHKVNQLKDKEEMLNGLLPDIRLLYGTQPGTRTPVMYQPGIVFLFSGHKIGYINERTFRYDTNEYLLLTVPLPPLDKVSKPIVCCNNSGKDWAVLWSMSLRVITLTSFRLFKGFWLMRVAVTTILSSSVSTEGVSAYAKLWHASSAMAAAMGFVCMKHSKYCVYRVRKNVYLTAMTKHNSQISPPRDTRV